VVRWTGYGCIAAFILGLVVATQGFSLDIPIWLAYFKLVIFPSVMVAIPTVLQGIAPSRITVQPKHLIIQSDGNCQPIPFDRIIDWSIGSLPRDSAISLLRIRYFSPRKTLRYRVIGVPQSIDLLELDRAMAARRRLSLRTRRKATG
jgi:hypothetical protein